MFYFIWEPNYACRRCAIGLKRIAVFIDVEFFSCYLPSMNRTYKNNMCILCKRLYAYAQLHTYGVRSASETYPKTRHEREGEQVSPSLSYLATIYHPEWGEAGA